VSPFDTEAITRYAGILGKGFVAEMAPKVAKGALVDMLRQQKIGVKEAAKWVEEDVCLWDTLQPQHQKALIALKRQIGSVDWLTADWLIGAIKADLPALASLFLGWRKAHNWLVRQVGIIKARIET